MGTGIDSLPLFHPITLLILGFFSVLSLVLFFLIPSAPSGDRKAHAVITGGSSGIGLGIAKECAERGIQNITLIARNKAALEKAQQDLAVKYPSTKFFIQSCDVGDYRAVEIASKNILTTVGPPTLLFNNAGVAVVHAFLDVPIDDFEKAIRCNYLGIVYTTKAFLPSMQPGSVIMMTSSMAGIVGVFGYSAYSPSKFAIRGFAECLQSEVRRNGIAVSVAFPPDTDTPTFAMENRTKPKETFLISDAAISLEHPDAVAKKMVKAALSPHPPFFLYLTFEGWMLSTLSSGMSPIHSLFDALCQVLLMGWLRLVSLFYLWNFTRIIAACGKSKKE